MKVTDDGGKGGLIEGLAGVAERYDGFILDLWGTIHDGYRPLPGAVECLSALRERGKRILILSNAPRRSASAIERMDRIGIPGDLYDGVLTSGESANLAFRRPDSEEAALGRKAWLMGPPEDDSVFEDLDLDRVDAAAEADFIMGVGSFERTDTVADYEATLSEARAAGVPMICANPDLEVLRGEVPEICAGAIAERYEAMGGRVLWHGKPFGPIYDLTRDMIGIDDPQRLLAVGDSLRTDVAGAAAAGIDSVFISSGLEARPLGVELGGVPEAAALEALYARRKAWPTWAMPLFRW